MDCSIEARDARSDRRAVWLYRGTLLGFRIVVLYRDSAPSSAPQPQTQWRGLRLPTTCALWRKFKKNPKRLPSTPLYSRMRELRIIWGMKALDADTISFVWTSIQQRYSVKRGGSRSCLTCAKCGAMGNCHTSGSSPRSGAGFSALLCSSAGSWTRSRTPGNFSLRAPSTKAQLKWASARYKDSYAIRRYDILLETRQWTGGSQSVGWVSAAQKAAPAFRGNHLKPQRANCDICMSAFSRDPLCLQFGADGVSREVFVKNWII